MCITRRTSRRAAALLAGATVLGGVAACGEPSAAADSDGVAVLAAFYPLQFAAERVGGDRVDVTNLTAPGAEPHDLELTPQDVGRLSEAALVVHLEGFQPAVDEAVAGQAADAGFDVSEAARLDLADEGGAADPHFWLDPLRLADVGDALAQRLSDVDPDGAAQYADGADALRADLETLDAELTAGLASCASRDLVTSHTAFGYLAERYDLEQVGLAGLSPDAEPSAADLAAVADEVRARGVTTVYSETLVSADVAETVAAETGAATAVLDPLEGLADADGDYLSVMRDDLAVLRAGQGCT